VTFPSYVVVIMWASVTYTFTLGMMVLLRGSDAYALRALFDMHNFFDSFDFFTGPDPSLQGYSSPIYCTCPDRSVAFGPPFGLLARDGQLLAKSTSLKG